MADWPKTKLCRYPNGHVGEIPAVRPIDFDKEAEVETYVPEKQARQQQEDELLSDEAVEAATRANAEAWDEDLPHSGKGIIAKTLRAALAATKKELRCFLADLDDYFGLRHREPDGSDNFRTYRADEGEPIPPEAGK